MCRKSTQITSDSCISRLFRLVACFFVPLLLRPNADQQERRSTEPHSQKSPLGWAWWRKNVDGLEKEKVIQTLTIIIGRPPRPLRPDGQHRRQARNNIMVRKLLSIYSCPDVLASHRQHWYDCRNIQILKIDGVREVNASIDFGCKNKFTLLKWIE